jgi:hypothetical protein
VATKAARRTGPADDEAGEQIENHREVQLAALADHECARIADPALIRALGRKLLLQEIGRNRLVVMAVGRHFVALAHAGLGLCASA